MQFYVLNEAPTGADNTAGTHAIMAKGYRLGNAPRCEACGNYTGMLPWLPPYRVELDTWGHAFGDLAFCGSYQDLLVSGRFLDLWNREGLLGLSGFDSVEVVKVRRHRKLRSDRPSYFRASVPLSRAIVDIAASGMEMEEPPTCPVCQLGSGMIRWKAIIIRPETWSGEDVFRPRWAGGIYVTDRFREFCKTNSIENSVFIPAVEYGHDFWPGRPSPVQDQ